MNIEFRAGAGVVLEGRPAPSGTTGVSAILFAGAQVLSCMPTGRGAAQVVPGGARRRAEWGPATGAGPAWGAREPRQAVAVAMRRFLPSSARAKP